MFARRNAPRRRNKQLGFVATGLGGVGPNFGSGGRFNVQQWLFGSGEQGGWWDPSDLTTMFQDSAGTTPVTAVGQPVGLMLDKRLGAVLGGELATASYATPVTFDNVTTSTSASSFTQTAGTTASRSYLPLVTVAGRWYKVTYTVASISAGTMGSFARDGNLGTGTILTTGLNTLVAGSIGTIFFQATSAASSILWVSSTTAVSSSITGVTVRDLQGNHRTQATAASRPTLRARYNALLATEILATQSYTAPVAASHRLSIKGTGSVALSGATTGSLAGTGADVRVSADFSLAGVKATPTISSVTTATTGGTLAEATDYSYRVAAKDGSGRTLASAAVTVTTGAGATNSNTVNWGAIGGATGYDVFGRTAGTEALIASVGAVTSYVDDGSVAPAGALPGENTTGVTTFTVTGSVTQADLRSAADAALDIPAYQRVTTSTDYDTAGFPMYLSYDGVDDSMATGSVDFSATDKMTVFAGIQKANDAAAGFVAELTASSTTNTGAFSLAAPAAAARGNYFWRSKGTVAADFTTPGDTYPAPTSNVLTGIGDIAGDSSILRINGAQVGNTVTDQGTGNFSNAVLYFGRRGGTTSPFNGREYQTIIRGAATESALLTAAERFIGSKMGIAL